MTVAAAGKTAFAYRSYFVHILCYRNMNYALRGMNVQKGGRKAPNFNSNATQPFQPIPEILYMMFHRVNMF